MVEEPSLRSLDVGLRDSSELSDLERAVELVHRCDRGLTVGDHGHVVGHVDLEASLERDGRMESNPGVAQPRRIREDSGACAAVAASGRSVGGPGDGDLRAFVSWVAMSCVLSVVAIR